MVGGAVPVGGEIGGFRKDGDRLRWLDEGCDGVEYGSVHVSSACELGI